MTPSGTRKDGYELSNVARMNKTRIAQQKDLLDLFSKQIASESKAGDPSVVVMQKLDAISRRHKEESHHTGVMTQK